MEDEERPKGGGASEEEVSSVALGMALTGASRDKADHFLDEHIRILRREDRLRHRQLRLQHIGQVLKVGGELFIALIVAAIAAAIGTAMWNAAHDRGLVVEAFSVPPDMQQRGLTGQVVAARLLDRLIEMQNETDSKRAASSYANNWGSDIKVQIPDTGISLSELYRYLRSWLGSETHIIGDIFHNPEGITVTARTSASAGVTFSGKEQDLDSLLQKAAESVYARTQPYRYAVFLDEHKRYHEAETQYRNLISIGSREDRAWALIGLGNLMGERGDVAQDIRLDREALAVRPDFFMAIGNLAGAEGALDHDELQYSWTQRAIERDKDGPETDLNIDHVQFLTGEMIENAELAASTGNFGIGLHLLGEAAAAEANIGQNSDLSGFVGYLYASLHDAANARAALGSAKMKPDESDLKAYLLLLNLTGENFGDTEGEAAQAAQFPIPHDATNLDIVRDLWSAAAEAMARLGNTGAAGALINKTPVDCDICARTRGRIASMRHDWHEADRWFALVSTRSPSIPFADTDWGQSLLQRGQPEKAIVKFQSAHQKGPHFADPLEMWGEALMLVNRSDLALAKYEAANIEAPNWGRLHLEWGKALYYLGRNDEAKKQFATAARLSLFPQEKTDLARENALVSHRNAH